MALPQQLKTARMNTGMLGNTIPTHFGEMESALADILGLTANSDVTASAMSFDNSGHITKALVEQYAAGPVGWRFRNSSNNKEMRIAVNGTNLDFDENTGSEAVPVWTNRFRIAISTGALTGQTFSSSSAGLAPASGTADATKFLNGAGGYTVPAAITATSCKLRNSTSTSVPNGTFTTLTFDTEDWDSGGMHSGANPTRITAPTAGKYMIVGSTGFAANVSGRRVLDIRDSSGTIMARTESAPDPASASQTFCHVAAIVNMTAGGYVELVAWQNSGSSLLTVVGSAFSPLFEAYKIGG